MWTAIYLVAGIVSWIAFFKRNSQFKKLRNVAEDLRMRNEALKKDSGMLAVRHESYGAITKEVEYLREAIDQDRLVWKSYDERSKWMKEFYPWSR